MGKVHICLAIAVSLPVLLMFASFIPCLTSLVWLVLLPVGVVCWSCIPLLISCVAVVYTVRSSQA